ncbi:hypothetical protein EDB19DRAFT_1096272 [Suillus lakei]|nr:hypothetical protein EDB19DRAFT_1096272 [Suillus lakei]
MPPLGLLCSNLLLAPHVFVASSLPSSERLMCASPPIEGMDMGNKSPNIIGNVFVASSLPSSKRLMCASHPIEGMDMGNKSPNIIDMLAAREAVECSATHHVEHHSILRSEPGCSQISAGTEHGSWLFRSLLV